MNMDQLREYVHAHGHVPPEVTARAQHCVPPEVSAMAAKEQIATQYVSAAQATLNLRQALQMVTPDFIPAAGLEAAVSKGQHQVSALREAQRELLIRACESCPSPCAAKMTRLPVIPGLS